MTGERATRLCNAGAHAVFFADWQAGKPCAECERDRRIAEEYEGPVIILRQSGGQIAEVLYDDRDPT